MGLEQSANEITHLKSQYDPSVIIYFLSFQDLSHGQNKMHSQKLSNSSDSTVVMFPFESIIFSIYSSELFCSEKHGPVAEK